MGQKGFHRGCDAVQETAHKPLLVDCTKHRSPPHGVYPASRIPPKFAKLLRIDPNAIIHPSIHFPIDVHSSLNPKP